MSKGTNKRPRQVEEICYSANSKNPLWQMFNAVERDMRNEEMRNKMIEDDDSDEEFLAKYASADICLGIPDDHSGEAIDCQSDEENENPVVEDPVVKDHVVEHLEVAVQVNVKPKITYEQKKENLLAKWKSIMPLLAKAYLGFFERNCSVHGTKEFSAVRSSCTCSGEFEVSKKINFFLWDIVHKSNEFFYCTNCKTLPVALVDAGFFPLSPESPSGAIQFGLCQTFVNLRHVFNGSGKKIAEFFNQLPKHIEMPSLSGESCLNTIVKFSEMIELAEEIKAVDILPACPNVSITL